MKRTNRSYLNNHYLKKPSGKGKRERVKKEQIKKKSKLISKVLKKIITILILLILANWMPLLFYIPFYDILLLDFDGSLNIMHLIQTIGLFLLTNTLVFGGYTLIKLELQDLYDERGRNK